ncbi:MAG TPA: ABC transporter permease subunit [Actinobacteria bacterium]|nr:ABC transporter permease subunit [Actinomycetota bacterium]
MKDGLRIPLMLTPALGLVVLLFGGGLLVGFGQSLGYFPAIGLRDITLRYYVSVFTDKNFLQSLWLTFRIAAETTVLSSVLAVALTLVLRQKFTGSRFVTFLFQVPLPVPHLVAASGIVLLVTQSGLIARVLAVLGLINVPADFPALVFDRAGVTIVLTFLWKEVPFIGLVVLAILQSVGPQYEELARTLGANARQRFFSVLLPLIMPGILSTSIIIFAFTFGNYEIPLLLGVRFPATLPVVAYRQYQDPDLALRPEAMAIILVLAVVAVLLLVAYRRLARYAVR